jgi:DNA-binding response OmpR family regulator
MNEPTARILVVDDDPQMRRMLRRYLEAEGFAVMEAEDQASVEAALSSGLDLITLDLNLGRTDGLTIARTIRQASQIPIIMITGKSDMVDMVVGLEVGADDYIGKPFHLREVLARIRSVLRRTQASTGEPDAGEPSVTIAFDGFRLHLGRRDLMGPDDRSRPLTTAEFDLLVIFARNPNRVLDRDTIMDLLKGRDWTPTDRTIDNQVARLRKKIEDDPAHPRLLKTVRGSGYSFCPAELKRF